MLLSSVLQLSLLSVVHHLDFVSAAKCNHDNCLRALNPTGRPGRSSVVLDASSFCATYTTAIVATQASYPAYATSACGTAASKYSSACSCAFPAPPTGTGTGTPDPCSVGNAVKNGNFEGAFVDPPEGWTVKVDAYKGSLTSPMATSPPYKGRFSVGFQARADPFFTGAFSEVVLSQNVPIVQGSGSFLQFRYFFPSNSFNKGGRLFVRIDSREYGPIPYDSSPHDSWVGQFFTFTPRAGPTALIEFVARSEQGQDVTVYVDAVFVPKTNGALNPCV